MSNYDPYAVGSYVMCIDDKGDKLGLSRDKRDSGVAGEIYKITKAQAHHYGTIIQIGKDWWCMSSRFVPLSIGD